MSFVCDRTVTHPFDSSQCRPGGLRHDALLSRPANALFKLSQGPMAVTALRRMLSKVFVSSKVSRIAQGQGNRRGQDKSRKVRTVGSVRSSAKFRLVRNIARVSRNLRFSATHYRRSTFYTLRSER